MEKISTEFQESLSGQWWSEMGLTDKYYNFSNTFIKIKNK